VARRRPPRAMRPHPAVRIARVTVPAALARRLAGMAGAVPPGDEPRVAYPTGSVLKPATIRVPRAVCHRYPQVQTLCGLRASHRERHALDCMIYDSTAGWDIAKWIAIVNSLGVAGSPSAAHLATKFRWLASDVGPQFTDRQSEPRTRRGLRRQRHRLVEASKQP
jgi:hypothetical protein